MEQGAGRAVRPYPRVAVIAPPANRSRCLVQARPGSGGVAPGAGPAQSAALVPPGQLTATDRPVTAYATTGDEGHVSGTPASALRNPATWRGLDREAYGGPV